MLNWYDHIEMDIYEVLLKRRSLVCVGIAVSNSAKCYQNLDIVIFVLFCQVYYNDIVMPLSWKYQG